MAAAIIRKDPIPCFNGLDQIDQSEHYTSHLIRANEKFQKCFKKWYEAIPYRIYTSVADWQRMGPFIEERDFLEKIDLIVQYQRIHDDSVENLTKIQEAYQQALSYFSIPKFDPNTLTILEKMGVNMALIEETYKKLFDGYASAMNLQIYRLNILVEQIRASYKAVKLVLEPIAYQLRAGLSAEPYGLNQNITRYIDAEIDRRKRERNQESFLPYRTSEELEAFCKIGLSRESELEAENTPILPTVGSLKQLDPIPSSLRPHQIDPSQHYMSRITQTNEEFKKLFKTEFTILAEKMTRSAIDWEQTQATCTKEERTQRTNLVSNYRVMHDQAILNLQRIWDIYQETIQYCSPPKLDSETLKILQKMNVKVAPLEDTYRTLFLDYVEKMKKQQAACSRIMENIKTSYAQAKAAL